VHAVSPVFTLSCLVWGLCLLFNNTAKAKGGPACRVDSGNWLRVTVQAPGSPDFIDPMLDHLRAEFSPHGITICGGNSTGQPLADIHIVGTDQRVGIDVQVEDAVTAKRSSRTIDLRSLPPDARALTIALGAAELLRASWAEIQLRRPHAFPREVPSSVRETVDSHVAHSKRRASVALHAVGEEFSRGLRQAGVDMAGTFTVLDPWSITFRVGARESSSVRAPNGTIRSNAGLIGAGGQLRLTPPGARANVGVAAHVDCIRQRFVAEAVTKASARSLAGTGYLGSVGAYGAIELTQWMQIETEVYAGFVFKGVSAHDGPTAIVAMNGPWVGASLGLSFKTW